MQFKATLPDAELRRTLQNKVNEIRDGLIFGGCEYDGHRYDSDARSIQNITATVAAISAGVPLPDGFVWRSADNESIPHTAESLTALAGTLLDFVNACYARSFTLKDEIGASEAPELVDINEGWPEG